MFDVIADATMRFNRVHSDGAAAHRERMELILHTPALRANAALRNAELAATERHLDRLADIVTAVPETEGATSQRLEVKGAIKVRELSFRYGVADQFGLGRWQPDRQWVGGEGPDEQALRRRAGDHVIFTADTHEVDDKEFQIFPTHCIRGTDEAKLVDELAAIPLSLWAAENGYTKVSTNLLGL